MRILLTGRTGQVGSALERTLAPLGELSAFDRNGLDLTDLSSIRAGIQSAKPDIIVNAAAYTAVDRAEQEKDIAFQVNARAVKELAHEAKAIDALLIHFSTDYVFDGEKASPYAETDPPNPLNVYGRSKLEGERAVAASGCRHFIFRTSWVYGPAGRNFLRAILAAARAKPELRVVDDQRGAPTSSEAIAAAVTRILSDASMRQMSSGIYHMTAAGETTWYGFAQEILKSGKSSVHLVPVTTAEYGAVAPRPKNSLLDNTKARNTFGVTLPDWRKSLAAVLVAIH